MKVVFWDIDGCLNTPQTWGAWVKLGSEASLEMDLVKRARRLHLDTGAAAVLSSTWRISRAAGLNDPNGSGYEGTLRCLMRRGWPDARAHFIGSTPVFSGAQRGQEISHFLASRPEITSFVIIDDATDMLGVAWRHIHIDFKVGITDADMQLAAEMLSDSGESEDVDTARVG